MRIYAKSANSEGDKEPLYEHTRNDINAGRRLVQNLPFSQEKKEQIGKDLDLIIACHDVGKAATGFQTSLDTYKPWGKRHEILSASVASSLGLSDAVVFAVITHHKSIPPRASDEQYGCLPIDQIPFNNKLSGVWQEMANEFTTNLPMLKEEWFQICNYINRQDLTNKLDLAPLSTTMETWLNRSDQIESFPYEKREYISLLRGLTMSADHIASSGSPLPIKIPKLNEFKLTSYKLYGFQDRASKHKGNLILRAPTGSGKTEAALLWAQLNQGYNGREFYALPTTASINAMHRRVKQSFHDTNNSLVGLLHSRSASALYSMFQDNDAKANQDKDKNMASLVREMYYPIRVCTPHQILRYSLQGKGWEAMLSEFPNSVFVFDEIHAYNPKLTGLIMATVRYLVKRNATCLFLTATLPTFIRKIIEAEIPGISFIEPSLSNESDRKILQQKRHTIETVPGTILDNIDLIAKESKKAESTLVVCNHIPTAQQAYEKLKDKVEDTVLLHGQFTRKDRNEIEGNLRDRLPKVLVSTQVVEVSLDLDFEQGFTEPAAIDALVQRFGRINRYAKRKPALVYIFEQQHSENNKIYSEELRNKSLKILNSLSKPLGEEELNHAADLVYGNGYQGEDLEEYKEGLDYKPLQQWERYLIAGVSKNWIEQVIEEKEGTIELLHEQFIEEYNRLKDEKLFIKANDLLIPVRKWAINRLTIDNTQDPWFLTSCEYSRNIGLIIPKS